MLFKIIVSSMMLMLTACQTASPPDPRFIKKNPEPDIPPQVIVSQQNSYVLEDTMWQLTLLNRGVNSNKIQDGAFLSLQSGTKRFKGSSGCNRLMGSYYVHEGILKLSDIASTKMFCPNGGIIQEALLIEALTDTRAWRIHDKNLHLLNEKGETVAVFEFR